MRPVNDYEAYKLACSNLKADNQARLRELPYACTAVRAPLSPAHESLFIM